MYQNFNNQVGLSVRLKLSDFIETEREEEVMYKISSIYENLQFPFILYLWYEKDKDISHDILREFIKKWEGSLHYKTKIKTSSIQECSEFTWFNIVNFWDSDPKHRFRFQYIYAESILCSSHGCSQGHKNAGSRHIEIIYLFQDIQQDIGTRSHTLH